MSNGNIFVTVVIAAYKLEKYLPSCLDGLLKQTYQAFDILIIDDASPDNTLAIARAYQARSPGRITVRALARNTGRAARARNMALDSGGIRGKYVLFLDGDDDIEPDMIARLARAAREDDADIAICAFDRRYEHSGRSTKPELEWLAGARAIKADNGALAYINTALWNKLIRRGLIGDTRMPDIRVGEDALFLLALYQKRARLTFVGTPLIHYRVRALSAISNTNMNDIKEFGGALQRMYTQTRAQAMRETIAVAAHVHIGLSMASRAAANPSISIFAFSAWARGYFKASFLDFKGVKPLYARALIKKGGRGMCIWLAKWAYKLRAAPVMLCIMRLFLSRAGKKAYW